MSSTVSRLTRELVLTRGYEWRSATIGVVAIGLLIVLLAQKEVARGARTPRSLRVLDVAIYPLIVMFFVVVTVRFLHLVR
jgi:hypothetical protein